MQPRRTLLPSLIRLSGISFLFCLIIIILAKVVGSSIPSPVISFTLRADDFFAGVPVRILHLLDVQRGLITKVSDQPVARSVWSPDGTQMAFTSVIDEPFITQPFIWDSRNGETRALALPPDVYGSVLDWSPDSQLILVRLRLQKDSQIDELYTVKPDGSNLTQVTFLDDPDSRTEIWAADWSPLGHIIAFVKDADIYRIDSDGENLQLLTHDGENISSGFPKISPDENQIAFTSNRSGFIEVFVMNADGTDQRQLTWTPEAKSTSYWSPDGTRLLFLSTFTLEVLSISSGEKQLSIGASDYSDSDPWSPDGTHILYEVPNLGSRGAKLYMIDANGNTPPQLILQNEVTDTFHAGWKPQP